VKLWAFLFLLISSAALADIGSVIEVTGAATIKRGSNLITVIKGTPVELNDRIETKSGIVNIKFKDDTTVKVTEHSALLIDDFVYDPKTQGGKLGLKAAEGTVRYVSGNIAHNNPNAVNIKTPTAAIAVRGTDFVMSVDAAGKSMVILMPTCETNPMRGSECGSGQIDVSSGGEVVHLDKPYQATIVETDGNSPSTPIVVNLFNTPVGNNLHLSPPRTLNGISIVAAAKTAAEKTGDIKKDSKKDDGKQASNDSSPSAETTTTDQQQKQKAKVEADQAAADAQAAKAVVDISDLKAKGINVKDASTGGDFHVSEMHKGNNPDLQQIGWAYDSLSDSKHNFTGIELPMGTQVVVIVTQDHVTDAYNFNTGSAKAYGSITITQNYR
jgi:hypothetical protein